MIDPKIQARIKRTVRKIPHKLSDAIFAAVTDLSAAERAKRTYAVNMGTWHEPAIDTGEAVEPEQTKCQVCFAGSLLAGTCEVPPQCNGEQLMYGENSELQDAMFALNEIRLGNLRAALKYWPWLPKKLHPKLAAERDSSSMTYRSREVARYAADYRPSRVAFKRDMRKIAAELAALGA